MCSYSADQVREYNIDGLVQDCSNCSALAMELLQYCTKPSTRNFIHMAYMCIYCQVAEIHRDVTLPGGINCIYVHNTPDIHSQMGIYMEISLSTCSIPV